MSTTLYRFYDKDGTLLYVGITDRDTKRMAQHESDKHWWPQVVRADFSHFESRRIAERHEETLIRQLRPVHNIARTIEHEVYREVHRPRYSKKTRDLAVSIHQALQAGSGVTFSRLLERFKVPERELELAVECGVKNFLLKTNGTYIKAEFPNRLP